MSRCFPYPPLGYEAYKSRNEGLIDSFIKLQRGDKAKERKEKEKCQRERKEKKKERFKEHEKLEEKKNSIEDRSKDEGSQLIQEGADHRKRKYEELEQLDESNITEEHQQPTSTQGFYDSADSTQSSAKKQKLNIVTDAAHNQGNGLRIGLPILRSKDQEPLSGEEPAPPSCKAENLTRLAETTYKYNVFKSCIHKMETRLQDLMDKWKPL